MFKAMFYPSPVSKRSMWRDLFDAAGVEARPGSFIFRLPFASDADRHRARIQVEARAADAERKGTPVPSAAEREEQIRRLAATYHRARRVAEAAVNRGVTHLAIWNGTGGRRDTLRRAAAEVGLKGVFAELAPFPGRITLDPRGVNAGAALPADPEFYRAWDDANPDAVDLTPFRAALTGRPGIRRKNQGSHDLADGPFIFVPLQVRGDTQVNRHGGWVHGIPMLIEQLARASARLPKGWRLVFREHPSCRIGNAEQLHRLLGDRITVDNETDTFELVRRSAAVATLNSSVGLQSFLLGKPILVLGEANYALPGLVEHAGSPDALAAALANAGDWRFDEHLREAFLRFMLAEYYVTWPATDRARLGQQVRTRLAGRVTDWIEPAPVPQLLRAVG